MAAAVPSSWEELPGDLLGLVLHNLPCLADRVRLRAVCRPWRAGGAAKRHPRLPPPLPWLALRDGGLVDLQGAPVHCAPLLREGVFGYLAADNLAFLVHDDGGCSLVNPLSGQMLHLAKLASAVRLALDESAFYDRSHIQRTYVKAILSSSLLDSALDPLVATIIMEGNSIAISSCKQPDAISISMRRKRTLASKMAILGMSPEQRAERIQGPQRIVDIAFFHGKLYALTRYEGLRVIELDAGHLSEGKSSPAYLECIPGNPKQQELYNLYNNNGDPRYLVLRYLAESDGRLLMMRRWMSIPANARLGDHDRTVRFEVFQADLATAPGRWIKVGSLGGHAIFLGIGCSKSVLASQCAGGVQEDSIYFMHRVFNNPLKEFCLDPFADSGVFNMRDGRIMPLLPEAVMAELRGKQQFMTWFFPADA